MGMGYVVANGTSKGKEWVDITINDSMQTV